MTMDSSDSRLTYSSGSQLGKNSLLGKNTPKGGNEAGPVVYVHVGCGKTVLYAMKASEKAHSFRQSPYFVCSGGSQDEITTKASYYRVRTTTLSILATVLISSMLSLLFHNRGYGPPVIGREAQQSLLVQGARCMTFCTSKECCF